ncbi:Thioredoxin reductase 1, cytoplasmic [Hypsibius exemplaris]|uniref:thioredoxin-disulfide reductase (NADPH) n=1 Tax=Hypsibius exemplaris TaxID=2072580 RepID=A0A1W0XBS8_HYPEX|nr:Thioredoxin reductase 1, cytoplasmic [Hypsibius exemplaris]
MIGTFSTSVRTLSPLLSPLLRHYYRPPTTSLSNHKVFFSSPSKALRQFIQADRAFLQRIRSSGVSTINQSSLRYVSGTSSKMPPPIFPIPDERANTVAVGGDKNGSHEGEKTSPQKTSSDASASVHHQMSPQSPANTSPVVDGDKFDYDFVVIGGGSGGLAASKEASRLGAKVAVFDYVQPTPIGTKWGLGGTCVNVGCIPKKMMHQASLLGEAIEDAKSYGWELAGGGDKKHNWGAMVQSIQDFIHSLNWKYKVALRDVNVSYINSYAKLIDKNHIHAVNAKGKEVTVSAAKILIATGGRPKYPEIPGAKEYGITSDDIFSLQYPPGKTLCVGASYVSLECAGFLAGLGFDTTVMVRSILLRGFDQDMAERIGRAMEESHHVKFIRGAVPSKIEEIEPRQDGKAGRLRVTSTQNGKEIVEEYNTVLFAVGRDACTSTIGLEKAGVKVNPDSGKINAEYEQTNVPNIYAIGDVLDGRPELTPVAIQAGNKLARRLFAGSKVVYDYEMVPTTVFTPVEYGCIGLAEEVALKKYGKDNIEVYHGRYRPVTTRPIAGYGEEHCYAKLICNKLDDERVVGLHVLGPNAGEITQGFALGMRLGAKKRDFDDLTGIHPTDAENFVSLLITRSSGVDLSLPQCCG